MEKIRFVALVMVWSLLVTAGAVSAGDAGEMPGARDLDTALAPGGSARTVNEGELFSAPFPGTGATTAPGPEDHDRLALAEISAINLLPPVRGRVGIESLIGKRDSRVRIYAGSAPASANALITFKGGYCTGWFYGPNVLATAGHCVHGGKGGAYHENVTVYPAYDAGAAPQGSYVATSLYAPPEWRSEEKDDYDYGFIALDQNVGNSVGYYGVWAKTGSLKGLPTIIAGYPSDKQPVKSLWMSSDMVRISKSRRIFYKNDTQDGQSGSAVWLDRPVSKGLDDGPYAYAIHTSGTTLSPTSTNAYNSATRIDRSVFESMMIFQDMNRLP